MQVRGYKAERRLANAHGYFQSALVSDRVAEPQRHIIRLHIVDQIAEMQMSEDNEMRRLQTK